MIDRLLRAAAILGLVVGVVAAFAPAAGADTAIVRSSHYSGELAWAWLNGQRAYTSVTGAWAQPAVAPSVQPEFADTWVGVTAESDRLLQAGTTAESVGGGAVYAAWVVAWNGTASGATVIPDPVAPGDRLRVSLLEGGSREWRVTVTDEGRWVWSRTYVVATRGLTAAWIEEAPGTWSTPLRSQSLADYGSVRFTTVRAQGGAPKRVTRLAIESGGEVVSSPSSPSATGAFTVRYVGGAS